jgi:signal transduction histidine kinase
MSHEIRTPMNGILGFAELLKSPNLTGEDQQEFISIIEYSGNRMLNLLDNIICFSEIESNQSEISLSETNINEQIKSIYSNFKTEVGQKGIEISFRNSLPEEKAIIYSDPKIINTIITNLLKNAIKFTHKGQIYFGYIKKGKFLEFFVKDTGVGICKEHQKVIFERFRQVSESLSRDYEGAGLGLSISKAYVEMLGGKIWVKSSSKRVKGVKGAKFYFTIPYATKSELTLS